MLISFLYTLGIFAAIFLYIGYMHLLLEKVVGDSFLLYIFFAFLPFIPFLTWAIDSSRNSN